MATILLVEDDHNLREALTFNLNTHSYTVVAVTNAAEAEKALSATIDLIVLDVMLPGEDGYAWCRRVRAQGITTPVLMLTARTLEDDVVRGFEAGAQDYVTKPYRLRELLARVSALLRRSSTSLAVNTGEVILFDAFTLDVAKRALTRRDTKAAVELTKTELDLLIYFLRHRDRALARDELLQAVWGDVVVEPRTVDNFVSALKKKLGWSPESLFAIHTIRGVGYRFETMTQR